MSQHLIECKVVLTDGGLETTIDEGALRTVRHMNRCATESGPSVIFDQRPGPSWEGRAFRREELFGETPVTVGTPPILMRRPCLALP